MLLTGTNSLVILALANYTACGHEMNHPFVLISNATTQ